MEKQNDVSDEELKLRILKEINRVIRGHQLDRKQTLTVGDIMSFIDIAVANVRKSVKINKIREGR